MPLLLIHPATGDTFMAREGEGPTVRALILDGYQPIGPKGQAAAAVIRDQAVQAEDTEDSLTALYGAWLTAHAIPEAEAMEVLLCGDLTAGQRAWLTGFITRWEAAVQ